MNKVLGYPGLILEVLGIIIAVLLASSCVKGKTFKRPRYHLYMKCVNPVRCTAGIVDNIGGSC